MSLLKQAERFLWRYGLWWALLGGMLLGGFTPLGRLCGGVAISAAITFVIFAVWGSRRSP